jgi:hypothetical protein
MGQSMTREFSCAVRALIVAMALAGAFPPGAIAAGARNHIDRVTHGKGIPAAAPPMGWNPWNAFRTNVDENKFLSTASTLIDRGMADAGYKYIIIDDGWSEGRTPEGDLRISTTIFPSAGTNSGQTSFSPFVDRLHALGLKAGIYTDIGRNTCAQFWDANSPNLPVGSMSAREVGSFGHQKEDARLFFSKWHFDYIKVDACGIADYGPDSSGVKSGLFRPFEPLIIRGDPSSSNINSVAQLYDEFSRAAKEATAGQTPVFEICAWGEARVADWAYRYGNAWRTSADIVPSWKSMLHNFDTAAPRTLFAGPGHWNDPDLLEVGNGEFDSRHLTEARAQMSLWAIIAAPLILSYDISAPQPALAEIVTNREMIAIDQDPAGNQGAILSLDDCSEVVAKSLASRGAKAVAMINRENRPCTLALRMEDIHLNPTEEITIRNVWKHTTDVLRNGKLEITLAARETALFTIQGSPLSESGYFLDEMPAEIAVVSDDQARTAEPAPAEWVPARIGYLPTGQPIFIDGKRDVSSIGIASGYHLRVALNKRFRRFRSIAKMADSSDSRTASTFSVYGDGKLLYRRKGEKRLRIDVAVDGVQSLELIATINENGLTENFVWDAPEVIR